MSHLTGEFNPIAPTVSDVPWELLYGWDRGWLIIAQLPTRPVIFRIDSNTVGRYIVDSHNDRLSIRGGS